MKAFYKRFGKSSKNDFKIHLKAEQGEFSLMMAHTKILRDAFGKIAPKEMITYEHDVDGCILIVNEKKERMRGY